MDSTGDKIFDEDEFFLPNGDKINLDKLISEYKNEKRIPFPTSAQIETIDEVSKSCRINWSFASLDRLENVEFAKNILINYDKTKKEVESIKELPGVTELNTELFSVTSESGHYRLILHKTAGKDNKFNANSINQRIDIWNLKQNTILKSIDIDVLDKHGPIFLHPRLSKISFSPDETKILYIAEKKEKSESYFKETNLIKDDSKKDDSKLNQKSKGNEYEYRQDWGESTNGLIRTNIIIITLKPELKIQIIELPDLTLGKPFWLDNHTISFIGLKENPKKLGFRSCFNRITYLYKCKLAQNSTENNAFEIIRGEKDNLNIDNPQINPQKEKVFFFENAAGGAHIQSQKICLWDLKTNEIDVVFDEFEKLQPVIKSLFFLRFDTNCWLDDGENIVLTTINHSREILFILNVITKKLEIIETGCENVEILNLKNNLLIISASSPDHAPVCMVGLFNFQNSNLIEFKQLHSEYPVKDDKITYQIIKQNEDKSLNLIETIVIGQTKTFNEKTPAIVFLHGGPHVSYTTIYSKETSFFVRLGFKVVKINYRGSLGVSKDYVNQLCGNIGDFDVEDCMSSIKNLINLKLIDEKNVTLFGGSHGGFLACSLIGKYPEFGFNSCICINPVTDIHKLLSVTDIPDWSLIETFGLDIQTYKNLNNWQEENNLVKQLDHIIHFNKPELAKEMFSKSPISLIDKVKTPLLMLLGKLDKRVPFYQGLSYFHALKIRNVETKCYVYPDDHSINKVPHNSDLIINSTRWILTHMKV